MLNRARRVGADKMTAGRTEATQYLTARYAEQVAMYPRTANVPLGLYLARNLAGTMRLLRDKRDAAILEGGA